MTLETVLWNVCVIFRRVGRGFSLLAATTSSKKQSYSDSFGSEYEMRCPNS